MIKRSFIFALAIAAYAIPCLALIEIKTTDEFNHSVLQSTQPVVVRFAGGCTVCKTMDGTYEEIAKTQAVNYTFAAVNIDKSPDLAKSNDISAIPSFLFFKNGKKVGQVIGRVAKEKLEKDMKHAFSK